MLCGAILGAYAALGPMRDAAAMTGPGDAMAGVLRHGNLQHMALNLALVAVGGSRTERQVGSLRMLALALVCAVFGTLAQYALTGPAFVGASGVAYGLVAHSLLAGAMPRMRPILVGGIAVVLMLEAAALSDQLAVATHIVSTLIGGSYAMFGSLFGAGKPALRPMKHDHIPRVVAIIGETDEDDALEAGRGFMAGELEGMFVLVRSGRVIGVTGFGHDEQVPDIAWLSWTYLAQEEVGGGLGGTMLNDLLGRLKGMGVRKLFIATSDYAEDGVPIYAAAHRMYEDFGAEVELTVPDYHAPGEAKIVYGLANPEYDGGPAPEAHADTGLAITGAEREPETDGTAGLIWEALPQGVAGMDERLAKVRQAGARLAVLAVPGDISDANGAALGAHGFVNCGQLSDYHAPGLPQVWWSCSLVATSGDRQ